MMQAIRDAITGWLAYAVIAVLIVPFAFWGVGDYFGFFGENYAVKVNDVEIPLQRYRASYNQRYTERRDAYGDAFDPDLIDEPALRQQVIDDMVEAELLHQYAIDRGLRTSDARLVERIHAIPAFQEGGVFSTERYRYLLEINGLNPSAFENDLRRSMTLAQLQSGIVNTAFMPDALVDSVVRIIEQRREFAWVEVPVDRFYGGIEVTDEAIAEYYERNARRFMTPERVTAEYVTLTPEGIAAEVQVTEAALRAFYDERMQTLMAGEERRARHIMVADESLATQLKSRLERGADFAELAAEHSEDVDTAAEGGDLGWIERGSFMPELEQTIYQLGEGEVSGPVKSGFGWHLIRVDEIRASDRPEFESMRDELAAEYRERAVESRYYELVERLADLAFENPDSLEPAADALGLTVERIEGVTRAGGDRLAADSRIRNALFSDEVLEQRFNSRLIELGDDRVAVTRVAEREPPRQRELAEVRDRIHQTLQREAARTRAIEAGEAIIERARAGEALPDLAREFGVIWHAQRTIGRGDRETPPTVIDAVFRAPRPGPDSTVIRSVRIGDDFAVFRLDAVKSAESHDHEQHAAIARSLAEREGGAQFRALLESLKADADIKYGSNLFDDSLYQ